MKTQLKNPRNWINIGLEISLILLPLIFIYLFEPFQKTLVYDTDEGLQLMRAFLLQKGYPLYQSIWSDQPPLYTWLLSFWTEIFEKSLYSGRVLTILFSLLLLWSFRHIISFYFGRLTSIFAMITLLFSKFYLQLSVSVMLAIPSLSLSVCSLYFLIIGLSRNQNKILFLIMSGILLGLATQFKFWVIILLPVSILYLITNGELSLKIFNFTQFSKKLLFMSVWLLGLIGSITLIIALAQSFSFQQLLNPHFDDPVYENFDIARMLKVNGIIQFDKLIFLFSFLGLFLGLLSGKKAMTKILIPILWLTFDLIAFWNHRPIWNHYYPIFSIPLTWLASYCFWWGWSTLKKNIKFSDLKRLNSSYLLTIPKTTILRCTIALAIISLSLYSFRGKFNYFSIISSRQINKSQQLEELISAISIYKKETNWIYTDNPILAVHTNLLVPPEVAVVSIKRMGKKGKYEQKLLEALKFYQPEQIVFMIPFYWQIRSNNDIMGYINKHYEVVTKNSKVEHYVLKSIHKRTSTKISN